MERSYTYFKNLLSESMDSVNQINLKSQLIEDFKETIIKKTGNLQEQINGLRKSFFLDGDETIIDKLNHIKLLQTSIGEKDEIIKTLKSQISSLKYDISSQRNCNDDMIDDLPF